MSTFLELTAVVTLAVVAHSAFLAVWCRMATGRWPWEVER